MDWDNTVGNDDSEDDFGTTCRICYESIFNSDKKPAIVKCITCTEVLYHVACVTRKWKKQCVQCMGESLERLTAKQVEELRSGEGVADNEEGFDIEYLRPHPSLPDVYQIKWIGHEKMTCESRASLLSDLTEADVASLLARGPRTLWVERPEFPVGVRVNVRYPRAKSKTVYTATVQSYDANAAKPYTVKYRDGGQTESVVPSRIGGVVATKGG
ncbi:hypothetical protein TeGR_g5900 [Tetraparma gracilis]|uniref:RING-type domain-containing protein n=1 Tax=Tetraparma gracilis TaxID=2962635 RepID=A0ABQ6NAC0_9STRA|nr:hypothetical protein TeGR_g5900 [Tetraparma gracilis]